MTERASGDIQDPGRAGQGAMIAGSCHCGDVRISIAHLPDTLTSCNCSICRRTGALMGYFASGEVMVQAAAGATQEYVWGDRDIAFVRCARCGCHTHWRPLREGAPDRLGINLRNFPPELLDRLRVRHIDGADTWAWLD